VDRTRIVTWIAALVALVAPWPAHGQVGDDPCGKNHYILGGLHDFKAECAPVPVDDRGELLGKATEIDIGLPTAVVADDFGNLFVSSQHIVYKVDAAGLLWRVAGNGAPGYGGDGGLARDARLDTPIGVDRRLLPPDTAFLSSGLALDGRGNLFVADTLNNRVRRIGAGGVITTVAGDGTFNGFDDGSDDVDGTPATSLPMSWPIGVAASPSGTLYVSLASGPVKRVLADGSSHTASVSTCSGSDRDDGTCSPGQLAIDAEDQALIPDNRCRVRRSGDPTGPAYMAFAGPATTIVGRTDIVSSDSTWWDSFIDAHCTAPLDGPSRSAHLSGRPNAVALGADGSLYIADSFFHCVRKLDATGNLTTVEAAGPCRGASGGDVACLARAGENGFAPKGGDASCTARRQGSAPTLSLPLGVSVDRLGNLYIADTLNSRVVKLEPGRAIVTIAGTVRVGTAP